MNAPTPSHPILPDDRRAFLQALAVSPFVLSGVGVFTTAARAQAAGVGLISPNVCLLQAEVTEGPYYLDQDLMRADITEDRSGVPLHLQLQIVDADCTPIEGARVDVWHCDAEGNYSGVSGNGNADMSGKTFLRGSQLSDERGVAAFDTIYPGWYRGRTTHIHYKVWLDDATILTSQIFFPDALSEYLFRNIAPYDGRASGRDTDNASDGIAQQAGEGAYALIKEEPSRYFAALVVGAVTDGGAAAVAPSGGQPPRPQLDGSGGNLVPGKR